jgi:O-antigen/teichoic acid export membrane protein/aminoglycoside phosphotransferase
MTGTANDDLLGRNTASLVASSAITSAIGVVFWVVAARLFDADEVGVGAATITAITMVGNLSTLGCRNALIRFIPAAGRATGRFVATVYAVCAAAAILGAVVFAEGTRWWAGELAFVRESPLTIAAFALFAAVWTLFVLQDAVLTGLRAAAWVPIENAAYAAAKLVLIVVLAAFPTWAFGIAWTVPAFVTLVPMTLLVRHRAASEATRLTPVQHVFSRRSIVRFAVGEQTSDVMRTLGAELVVLIVLHRRGPEASAPFFMAAAITATLAAFAANIAGAFTAEAAARPTDETTLLRRSAAHAGRVLVPAALATSLLAPWIMGAFGPSYREAGGTLLRVLALGAVPQAVIALGVAVARLRRRMVLANTIFAGVAAGPVLGALLVSRTSDLARIGVVAVAAQVVVASVLLSTILRPLVTLGPGGRAGARLVALRTRVRHARRSRQVAAVLAEIEAGRAERLAPRRVLRSDNDVAVVLVERKESPVVIKVALSRAAAKGLRRHADALEALHSSGASRLDNVPRVIERGGSQDHAHVIETARPGRAPIVADHRTGHATLEALRTIHELTVRYEPVDEDLLATLVDRPIDVLLADARLSVHRHALLDLRERLRASLGGRHVHTARTHGDCWTGNFLVTRDQGSTPVVTGIIDWEDSEARGLADLDGVHHWLAAQPDGLPAAVQRAMHEPTVGSLLLGHGPAPYDPQLPALPVVLLAWLAHVSNGLRRASRYPLGSAWVARNVVAVLRLATAVPSL